MSAAEFVHIVDDDDSFRQSLTRLLGAAGFEVKAYGAGEALLAACTARTRGCVIADLRMPGLNGLELQAALAKSGIAMPVIFLSGQGDIPSTVSAMRQGAADFLEKLTPKDVLLQAVKQALERDSAQAAERERLEQLRSRFALLTGRELEVLSHVVRGRRNKQIASELGIHERTVKLHRTSISGKLDVHSVAELAMLTREAGLVLPGNHP